jgi:hypothetical protein
VTIAAGFVASGAVVICADTQETYGDLLKISVPKITIKPEFHIPGKPRLVIAGAGSGPFIDKLAYEAGSAVAASGKNAIEDVAAVVEQAIKDTHQEFGTIYQEGAMPQADLIIGISAQTGLPRLYRADGPILNAVSQYGSVGMGLYMADYIADRSSHGSFMDARWAELLAIYLLQQAKNYIDGCGGDSHVITLKADGSVNRMAGSDIEIIGDLMKFVDRQFSDVLMCATDPLLGEDDFRAHMDIFMQTVGMRRAQQREIKRKVDEAKANHPLRKVMDSAKQVQDDVVKQLGSQKVKREQ